MAEIVRRTNDPQSGRISVVHLGEPPTSFQRLQLMSARLQRLPIAIMPVRCKTVEEWLDRYSRRDVPN